MLLEGNMSKRSNPFSFLCYTDSDTESASEGEFGLSIAHDSKKRKKKVKKSSGDSDVQILKVEPGRCERQVQIVKVEHGSKASPDIEIVKVVPGTSTDDTANRGQINWPITCRKINVKGSVGR